MSMFTAKSFLCLDFGAGSLKAAEFEVNHTGGLTLKQYGAKPLGLEGSQESKREKTVLAALHDLLASRGFEARAGNVCAPGFQVFSKIVKLPPVDNSKVTQIIQYEAQQNIPFPIAEAVWDYQILGAAPSGELEVLLVAIKADTVESLFRTCESAGVKPQLVDASPAALCNAFRFNYGDLEGCTMLLDIGAKTSNVLLFEKGKVFARSINIGANAITQDFVAEAKIPFAKAEELKVNEGFVSLGGAYAEPENPQQAAISKIARQVLTRLHIQVNQTIQFYRGQQGGSVPVRVFLAGGASIMPYTTQFFAEKLNIPVEYFNPFRNITIAPELDLEELAKVAHSFGEVVGLGLRNLAQCPVELNLIPKSIRSKQLFRQKLPYFAATLASLIAFVFAIGIFYSKVVDIKRDSLAQLNEKLTPLQARADQLAEQEKQIKNAQAGIDVYTGYLKNRFFWADALVEMRNLLLKVEEKTARPGQEVGVWIENLGVVDGGEEDEPEVTTTQSYGPSWMNEDTIRRYFPQMYPKMKQAGIFQNSTNQESQLASLAKPITNTNLVTINVKFRAVNLNNANDPSANGRLAFGVADEFKKSGFFDATGTKLNGDIEEPEMVTRTMGTFRFGMTLKLKNEMQL
jgi:type IV pilus assembly protein PilM